MNPRILFCDNHVMAVEKPAGLATQGDRHNHFSLTLWTRQWIKERFNKSHSAFAEPIHRLDKVTSGLVIFAKTSKALGRMVAEVREGRFHKVYFALVRTSALLGEGDLKHRLSKQSHRALIESGMRGAVAETIYRALGSSGGLTLLMLQPKTGRYHQLRAQLAHMGWPIEGDLKYGAPLSMGQKSIYLHHARCALMHPVKNEMVRFSVCAPDFWPPWALEAVQGELVKPH